MFWKGRKSLKASEVKCLFDVTVAVLICNAGNFSKTGSNRHMLEEMTGLYGNWC